GGFIPPSAHLPSPTPTTSTATPSLLPKPRAHPLRPGSAKEATVLEYIDKKLLSINRRHAKKFSGALIAPVAESERGYESFKEVAKDFESLVDVLWVSGTPSLQIPYLISLAVQVNSYLPDYPFSAKATFRLLRKLDSVFASLLLGEDVDSGALLPGFEARTNVVSMTEKVRIKSIAETCRVVVVEAREQEDLGDDDDDDGGGERNGFGDSSENDDEDELMDDALGMDEYPIPGRWEMETAKVYEKTIQLLGDELGQADPGEFCDTDMAAGE
ncbi:general transcription factor IIH subunit TFB6 family, partial [Aspergillus fijiensis CBS 313.89]